MIRIFVCTALSSAEMRDELHIVEEQKKEIIHCLHHSAAVFNDFFLFIFCPALNREYKLLHYARLFFPSLKVNVSFIVRQTIFHHTKIRTFCIPSVCQ